MAKQQQLGEDERLARRLAGGVPRQGSKSSQGQGRRPDKANAPGLYDEEPERSFVDGNIEMIANV